MCDACARVHLVHSLLLLDARQLLLSLMHLVLQLLILLLVLLLVLLQLPLLLLLLVLLLLLLLLLKSLLLLLLLLLMLMAEMAHELLQVDDLVGLLRTLSLVSLHLLLPPHVSMHCYCVHVSSALHRSNPHPPCMIHGVQRQARKAETWSACSLLSRACTLTASACRSASVASLASCCQRMQLSWVACLSITARSLPSPSKTRS